MLLMIDFLTHGVSDKSRNLLTKQPYRFQSLNLGKISNSVTLNHNQTYNIHDNRGKSKWLRTGAFGVKTSNLRSKDHALVFT